MAVDNNDYDPYIICVHQTAHTMQTDRNDEVRQDCPRCGTFRASGSALGMLNQGLGNEKRAKLSGWVRDQYLTGSVAMVTEEAIGSALARPLPSVIERSTRLLLEAVRGQKTLGDRFDSGEPRFLAATYSSNRQDVDFMMRLLADQDLAKYTAHGSRKNAEVRPRGYFKADELTRKSSSSKQGFVAMWFEERLNEAFENGFEKGIHSAGYDPRRVDRVEHVNRIDDEIIAQIKQSRFVVADFTGHRGGVYFEAGFALGLGLPVIWTCREDHMKELHFDIRQFNCIDWSTPKELAERLQKRIEAVLGVGPNKVLERAP